MSNLKKRGSTTEVAARPLTRTVPIHYPDDERSKPPVSKNSKPTKPNDGLLIWRAAQQDKDDPQPSLKQLAKDGVKVIDWAFLPPRHPPIKPYRKIAVQTQPSARLPGDDDEAHRKRRLLRRESTEPVIDFSQSQSQESQRPANPRALTRRGFKDLNMEGDDSKENLAATGCSQLSDADSMMLGVVSSQSQSQPVPPLTMSQSQDTKEEDIPTPLVTPNGSYDWSRTNTQETNARVKAAIHNVDDNLGLGAESQSSELPSLSQRRALRRSSPLKLEPSLPSRSSSPSPPRLPQTPAPNHRRKLVRATPRTSSQCDMSLPSTSASPAAPTRRNPRRSAEEPAPAPAEDPQPEGRARRTVRVAAPRAAPVATTIAPSKKKSQPAAPAKATSKRKRAIDEDDTEEEEEERTRAGRTKKAKAMTDALKKKGSTTKAKATAKGKATKAPAKTSVPVRGRTTRNSART